ncbi:MAG: hypothetical protein A3G26_05845 [Betaproteobacteria bacterium RIFCSPLOWO2_12_FULL_65_110]|nr:MAG: hypothetical protein A3G26_05845 [Betaproteobacteria bacterium RIFCSPLOWO2_12_FULL_65_110]
MARSATPLFPYLPGFQMMLQVYDHNILPQLSRIAIKMDHPQETDILMTRYQSPEDTGPSEVIVLPARHLK